jgi:hypothetical protein
MNLLLRSARLTRAKRFLAAVWVGRSTRQPAQPMMSLLVSRRM